MTYTIRGTVQTGHVLATEQDADGRQYITPVDPAKHKYPFVGVAAKPLADGAVIIMEPNKDGFTEAGDLVVVRGLRGRVVAAPLEGRVYISPDGRAYPSRTT